MTAANNHLGATVLSVDKGMVIDNLRLLATGGGKGGD